MLLQPHVCGPRVGLVPRVLWWDSHTFSSPSSGRPEVFLELLSSTKTPFWGLSRKLTHGWGHRVTAVLCPGEKWALKRAGFLVKATPGPPAAPHPGSAWFSWFLSF